MLVITEHDIFERTDDPRLYCIVAGAGLRLGRTRPEHLHVAIDDWSQYIERLGHYFSANDITDISKQKSILLSAVGAETYKLMHNVSVPNLPGTKTIIMMN